MSTFLECPSLDRCRPYSAVGARPKAPNLFVTMFPCRGKLCKPYILSGSNVAFSPDSIRRTPRLRFVPEIFTMTTFLFLGTGIAALPVQYKKDTEIAVCARNLQAESGCELP